MKRTLLVLAAALSLTACDTLQNTGLNSAPAPLATTVIDDAALEAAWKSHDVLQDAINLYIDAKPAFVGTPAARRVADINDAITAALTAAESAAAAGSTTNYLAALAQAKGAFAQMRTALAALRGK